MRIDNGQLFSASIENGAFVTGSLVGNGGVLDVSGRLTATGELTAPTASLQRISASSAGGLIIAGETTIRTTDTSNDYIFGNTGFTISGSEHSLLGDLNLVGSLHAYSNGGHITASGNISSSGDVIGLSGSFSDLSVSNLAAVGDTATDTINITGNTTFTISEGANSIKIFEAALGDDVLKFEATEEPELLFAFDPTNMGGDSDAQGRIGLGVPTSSIQSKLHVKHVTGSGAPASVLKLDVTGKDNLLFVSSSGNIGVGTGTPGKELEVIGHVSASGDVTANTGSFVGGLVLTSPNGTEYRFTVDNNGFLSITGSAA